MVLRSCVGGVSGTRESSGLIAALLPSALLCPALPCSWESVIGRCSSCRGTCAHTQRAFHPFRRAHLLLQLFFFFFFAAAALQLQVFLFGLLLSFVEPRNVFPKIITRLCDHSDTYIRSNWYYF